MGKIGRKAIKELVSRLRKEHKVDFCIANAENLAHGTGITRSTMEECLLAGIDFFTSGNHIWDKPEIYTILQDKELKEKIIRPFNYPEGTAGVGAKIVSIGKNKVLIANVMGQVFMRPTLDNPFEALDRLLEEHKDEDIAGTLVDFHADATSEKNAFGMYVDGRASAVWGTHSHVPTADERILPAGTAFVTDVGLTGFRDGVIGETYEAVIKSFITRLPLRHELPDSGWAILNAIIVEVDPQTKLAKNIIRVKEEIEIK